MRITTNLNKFFDRVFFIPFCLAIGTFWVSICYPLTADGQTKKYNTFAEWCVNRSSVSDAARHTIEVVLKRLDTTDCDRASTILFDTKTLELDNEKIQDLTPLSTLLNLESNNQITNLKPLASLTNLHHLILSDNPGLTGCTYPVKPETICEF